MDDTPGPHSEGIGAGYDSRALPSPTKKTIAFVLTRVKLSRGGAQDVRRRTP